MNYWNWILYIGASFVALRSLISLMTQHKEKFQQEHMQKRLEEIALAEAEAAKIKKETESAQEQSIAA
ncbi:hypothetical protein MNBD_PLANCTO02-2464 [hydrothermal vent metagenome]|uniref:Uncharacterized protein n=1 Tax=hydrothermal vent metagenome TaxID=652676 RepID=A0A3B1DRR9_9ZZZZ